MDTHTHRKKRRVNIKAEMGGCVSKPRDAKDCQQTLRSWGRGLDRFSLLALRRS